MLFELTTQEEPLSATASPVQDARSTTTEQTWAYPLLIVLLATALGVSGAPAPPAPDQLQLNGAGATFPYPIYSKWFDEYHKLHPDVEINYQSIGSGGGIPGCRTADPKTTRHESAHLR